ncbi:thioredoxin-dependent thiol peroxidase [Patescibacteria group bacterium]|nr:thioredoxin-dependent thiol peroxidase [Patescibacteria group bacterium]
MEGKKAPTFTTIDQHGNQVSLADLQGKQVLLYFYPKDMTSGCTVEANGFEDLYDKFKKMNTEILAVSRDSQTSHQKFCEKEGLTFPILVDEDGSITETYGVWKEKSMYGKKYMGISRESFLIDESGVIIKHWDTVKPANHPQEVLDYLKELK